MKKVGKIQGKDPLKKIRYYLLEIISRLEAWMT